MTIVLYCEEFFAAIFDGYSNLCSPCAMPTFTASGPYAVAYALDPSFAC